MKNEKMLNLTLGFILLLCKSCESIPLPGINNSYYQQIESPVKPLFLPFAPRSANVYSHENAVKYAQSDDKPSLLAASFGNANTILGSIPSTVALPKDTPHIANTQKSTLKKLLNSLFGNESWKKELGTLLDASTSTSFPITNAKKESPESKPQGFHSNHGSYGDLHNDLYSSSSHTGHVNSGKPKNETIDSHLVPLAKKEHKDISSFKTDLNGPDQTINPTSRNTIGVVTDATKHISSSGNISDKGNSASQIQQSISNIESHKIPQTDNEKFSIDGSREHQSAGVGIFNPNSVNQMNYVYNPDMFGFATQTGSRPVNADHKSTYDADALNRNIMHESFGHSPPGIDDKFSIKQEENGSSNGQMSANTHAESPVFDASALNMRLLLNGRNFVENVPVGVDHNNSETMHKPQKDLSTSFSDNINHENPGKIGDQKSQNVGTSDRTASDRIVRPDKTALVQSVNNFIPGDLYPGQQYSKQNTGVNNNGPPFLHGQNMNSFDQTFNPNALNAAQTVYNPNDISWLHTRSTQTFRHTFEVNHDNRDVQHDRFDASQNDETKETTSRPTDLIESASLQPIPSLNNDHTVFNPNIINSAQGQTRQFVPGQLMPDASLHLEFSNNNMYNNKNDSSEYIPSKYAFNPNTVNNLADVYSSQKNNSPSAMNKPFDPNVANAGFSNVLGMGNTNGSNFAKFSFGFPSDNVKDNRTSSFKFSATGGSSNEFDPNAVNVGFGSQNYGFGSSSSSFSNGFDANKLNRFFMQKPYGRQINATEASSTGSNLYSSSFIGSFNPDKVNTASYNPNEFNNLHLHFDPVDMLDKNPDMNKTKLQSSVFDPNKVNAELTRLVVSPIKMFQANQGSVSVSISKSDAFTNISTQMSTKFDTDSSPYSPLNQLMQLASLFKPGTLGGSQSPNHHFSSLVNGNELHRTTKNPVHSLSSIRMSESQSTTSLVGISTSTDASTTARPISTIGSKLVTLQTTTPIQNMTGTTSQ